MPRVKRSTWLIAAATALAVVGLGGSVTAAAAGKPAGHNPPGNNGTVKIDAVAFDDAPDNQPHVGCRFQVDFYGYDKGDLTAAVTFTAQPPTLPAGSDRVLLTDSVFIGEDDASGGGSQAGLDASRTYTLNLAGITPHPKQGVHVKLTVNAEGSQGADVKHKVFWVTGCSPSTPSTPPPTPTPTPPATSSPSTPPGTPPSTAPAEETCTDTSTDDTCQVVAEAPSFTG